VRSLETEVLVIGGGTDTCRWQIQQATGVETVHPVDVLHRAYGLG
jgi:glycerol-3-phosphate dehydrogenase subunit C